MMSNFSVHKPTSAMVLAAGLGTRMQPVTATLPKPLIRIAGRSLLDRALDRLAQAGIKRAVVNVHYLPELVEQHLEHIEGIEIVISDERAQLLETGGGTKKALKQLGEGPFFVVNTDAMWLEGPTSNLKRMMERWNPDEMDILLLLANSAHSIGHEGEGDFTMTSEGRLTRRSERVMSPFIYSGVGLIKPELFTNTPEGPFSLNVLFDRAIETGRLFGLRLDGEWLHVGTPDAILAAEEFVAASSQ